MLSIQNIKQAENILQNVLWDRTFSAIMVYNYHNNINEIADYNSLFSKSHFVSVAPFLSLQAQ